MDKGTSELQPIFLPLRDDTKIYKQVVLDYILPHTLNLLYFLYLHECQDHRELLLLELNESKTETIIFTQFKYIHSYTIQSYNRIIVAVAVYTVYIYIYREGESR